MSCDVGEVMESLEPSFLLLHLRCSLFFNPSIASTTSQLILQPFYRFTYITADSPTLLSLYLHHISFSNPSIALPTSHLILQPFYRFTYITAHSPTLLSLYLHHRSFSNPSISLPTSQIILQPYSCFTYVTAHSPTLLSLLRTHSPTLPSLYLRHSSFSKPSVALPMSQLILQPFRCFTYITAHSITLLLLLLCHRLFTYLIWQAAHGL